MAKRGWQAEAADVLRVGEGFRLADVDPDATPGYEGDKEHGENDLVGGLESLSELQERLFAARDVAASVNRTPHTSCPRLR